MVLVCIILMYNEIDYYFLDLLAICISSFVKYLCLFPEFCIFAVEFFNSLCILSILDINSTYILEMKLFVNIFSHSLVFSEVCS